MRTLIAQTMLLSLIAIVPSCETAADVPHNHPSISVLSKFSPHFRCPYANDWVAKGPQQAALDLGLLKNVTEKGGFVGGRNPSGRRRRAQQGQVSGSCVYTNSWSVQSSCLEFRGDLWTASSMLARCDGETDGALTAGSPCDVASGLGGWCFVGTEGSIEGTPLSLESGMDCDMAQTTCETFMSGTFEAGEGCAEVGSASGEAGDEGKEVYGDSPYAIPVPDGPVSCAIAPGAIGSGHQAAYSSGYSPACEGTPAEGSPYMWPMAWSANVESKSMAFGSDDVRFQSRGSVFYRLDKNWKRSDWHYQRGIQRNVGQAPCDPENIETELSEGTVLACRRDSDEYKTMIHRGSKMMFISWKNGTDVGSSDPAQISECTWLDLQVIGNIRPDWYMDARGDSTDVQYLGDQHVFYNNEPRLVKQWRKQDFANQYFVMSVLGHPKEDGIHWPMILNIPGEGFGDDFLQAYSNQTLLTEEDDYLFLLDEALEAIGGVCEKMEMGGGGPPSGDTVPIPSNLEVDTNAWFSNVYTYSPVWQTPLANEKEMDNGETGMATSDIGHVVVRSCYDKSDKSVQLSFEFTDIEVVGEGELPWIALGYRETEDCLMNPSDGSDTEIITVTSKEGSADVYSGILPKAARTFDDTAFTSIQESLTPLAETDGYSEVKLHLPSTSMAITKSEHNGRDSVTIHFKKSTAKAPEVMHLMYAIGSTPEFGYHRVRKCFDITEFPICPPKSSEEDGNEEPVNAVEKEDPIEFESSGGFSVLTVNALATFLVGCITLSVL